MTSYCSSTIRSILADPISIDYYESFSDFGIEDYRLQLAARVRISFMGPKEVLENYQQNTRDQLGQDVDQQMCRAKLLAVSPIGLGRELVLIVSILVQKCA